MEQYKVLLQRTVQEHAIVTVHAEDYSNAAFTAELLVTDDSLNWVRVNRSNCNPECLKVQKIVGTNFISEEESQDGNESDSE